MSNKKKIIIGALMLLVIAVGIAGYCYLESKEEKQIPEINSYYADIE